MNSRALLLCGPWVALACGPAVDDNGQPPEMPSGLSPRRTDPTPSPYATVWKDFRPGPGAGYGQDQLPDVVFGPPAPSGDAAPSLDVLSLGAQGELVLGFGEVVIKDGPGPDFVVFENPFWVKGDPTQPYAELAEVQVSADGAAWYAFTCDRVGDGRGQFPGCAGWRPTKGFDPWAAPLDPSTSGGDPFDLAEVGLEEARFVKVIDLDGDPEGGPTAGFDLDAIGVVQR